MEQLMSIEEAAKRLGGLSKWTIHAWLSQGRLRRTKVGGRTMIRESELQKVIEEGGRKSPSPRNRKGVRQYKTSSEAFSRYPRGEAPRQLPPCQDPSQLYRRGSCAVVRHSQEHGSRMDWRADSSSVRPESAQR